MKTGKNLSIALMIVLGAGSLAQARTDVQEKIAQLNQNREASKDNLKQYEDNLKTVNQNIAETDRALKSLAKQKQSLAQQTSQTAKSKQSVDQAKAQLDTYMKTEQTKLDVELKQIEELKKTLATLEANVQKRQANIAEYQAKQQKVDTELASWSERNQSIIELEQALKQKEDQAKADQKALVEKKAAYEDEVQKWRKQVRVSERTYENFSGLKD